MAFKRSAVRSRLSPPKKDSHPSGWLSFFWWSWERDADLLLYNLSAAPATGRAKRRPVGRSIPLISTIERESSVGMALFFRHLTELQVKYIFTHYLQIDAILFSRERLDDIGPGRSRTFLYIDHDRKLLRLLDLHHFIGGKTVSKGLRDR